ncbi:hypothetical protein GCM10027046_36650 [Uliginosibacterium flavum]|uniref:Uncharacterized protein n=1 Tax=Uliginosibacterium flavum TaxID=1396831 RepID=A0ABV2TNB6_9RHOO
MKRWALIALAIFASWLLDRAGWLKAILWGGLWLLLVLLVLALCGFLLDCVIHSQRPANAPRRPGLFRIVRESLQEVREGQAREAWQQEQAAALASTERAAQTGELAALEALTAQGLGDAWMLLAELQADPASPQHDDTAATASYLRAAETRNWVNDRASHAYSMWEARTFLGLGATPDYAALIRRWESHYVPGDGHEVELAWLYANGHGVAANAERAWHWLALHQARWGERDAPQLPEGDAASLRAALCPRVSQRVRARLEKEAHAYAHAEFVASR